MILEGTGSVLGGTDWYWLVLGATGSVYCGTGSEQGDIGCQCDVISENIWFTWCKPSNSSIIGAWYLVLDCTGSEQGSTGCKCDMLSENIWFQYSEKEKVMTDRQTNKVFYLSLEPFCGRGRVKITCTFKGIYKTGIWLLIP